MAKEENIDGMRMELQRLEQQARALRTRLDNFQKAKAVQEALGQPLTVPQKAAHLTAFEAERVGLDAKYTDVNTVIDSPTFIDLDKVPGA